MPWSATVAFHLPLAMSVLVTAVVVTAGDACAEHEPGEEDDGDDEHRPRDDADPCGDDVEPSAPVADDDRGGGGRGLDGTRCRFW